MTDKLIENESFADNFAGVLENSRIGERPNENLYSFLSNPVQSKNAGVISTGNTLPPYFLVLICFIVSLFTAYAISTNDRKRMQKDSFEGESTLVGGNTPITLITASIGLVEGLVIGIVSGNLLNIAPGQVLIMGCDNRISDARDASSCNIFIKAIKNDWHVRALDHVEYVFILNRSARI